MAQQETIKEFVAALGFKIDESSWGRFERGMLSATLQAKLLGDAIEAMARTVAEKIAQVADNFEQLFYQAQRIGASAASIRAFEYAVSQLGGTADAAKASLQAFGDWMRTTPGADQMVQRFGVATRDAQGHAIDRGQVLLDIGKRLGAMGRQGPAGAGMANRWAELFHIDPATLLAIERPGIGARYREELGSARSAGLDDLTKMAPQFLQTWRSVWQKLGDMSDSGSAKLAAGLTEPLKKFRAWLDQHEPELNSAIGKVTKSLDGLAITWADDLAKITLGDDQTKGINGAADAIAHFVDKLKPLIAELHRFNEESKNWWFIKFIDNAASGNLVTPLPDGPGFFASHGPGVSGSDLSNDASGIWGAIKGWWGRHTRSWFGGGSANYQDVPNAGNLTKLITEVSKEAGIDPRLMEGIRAGESGHGGRYDVNNNPGTGDLSYGPFQLNKLHPGDLGSVFERETAEERKRLGFGGLEDPRTIPMQARFVAQYIKRTGSLGPWAGFHGPRDADPRWGDAGYVPSVPKVAVKPADGGAHAATLDWSVGAPGWAAINAALPVGAAGAPSSVKTDNRQANVTNTINVVASDPQTAAAMVGAHLDRSAADVQRNLQGAAQ